MILPVACGVDHDSAQREAREVVNGSGVDVLAAIDKLAQCLHTTQSTEDRVGCDLDARGLVCNRKRVCWIARQGKRQRRQGLGTWTVSV